MNQMNKIKPLLSLLAAVTLLSSGVAKAQLLDIAVVNNGTTTTVTFEATALSATLPGGMTSTTGSTGDGFDLVNFLSQNDGVYGATVASPNVGEAPGATGWDTIIPNPTGTLAAADGPSAIYNGFYSDNAETSAFSNDAPDLELVSYPTPTSYTDQTFATTGAAFTGTMTEVFTNSDTDYNGLLAHLPSIGDTGTIMTGWSESGVNNPSDGEYGTPNYDIGTWKVVAYDDLPSQQGVGAGAAPEPRSWILAALVALAFLGICHLRLRTLDRTEALS